MESALLQSLRGSLQESAAGLDTQRRCILGCPVDCVDYHEAVARIVHWAHRGESRYVCVACVNTVMEAYDSAAVRRAVAAADLVTPDGMPLVWALRLLGAREARRVYGPDLTPLVLEAAARARLPVGFYGGAPDTLKKLLGVVRQRCPAIRIAYAWSPPFRPLTPEEDVRVVREINSSGARILFVGLNTPKQDLWMHAHRGHVRAVMLGVGAAFDFLAGTKPQAPRWIMPLGLEWLFRLATEPRRLWKRYLKHNPRFVALFGQQLLRRCGGASDAGARPASGCGPPARTEP